MHYSTNGHDDGEYLQAEQILDAPWGTPGFLMVVGGADRLDPEAHIARLFIALAERAEAHSPLRDIVLISTATRHPEVLTNDYIRIYNKLGIPRSRIHAPIIRNRDEAYNSDFVNLLANASGIFITGGDQYALTQALDRTPVEQAIVAAYGQGAVVGGTSAGATAMGRPMIVAGGGSGELRHGMVQISDGMGWAGDNILIDTHFGARGRFPRLAAAVAEHPHALGIGVDENSCLLINGKGEALVYGSGVVYFIDATGAEINSAQGALPGEVISVGTLNVNILSAGSNFHLRERRLILARAVEPAV